MLKGPARKWISFPLARSMQRALIIAYFKFVIQKRAGKRLAGIKGLRLRASEAHPDTSILFQRRTTRRQQGARRGEEIPAAMGFLSLSFFISFFLTLCMFLSISLSLFFPSSHPVSLSSRYLHPSPCYTSEVGSLKSRPFQRRLNNDVHENSH